MEGIWGRVEAGKSYGVFLEREGGSGRSGPCSPASASLPRRSVGYPAVAAVDGAICVLLA